MGSAPLGACADCDWRHPIFPSMENQGYLRSELTILNRRAIWQDGRRLRVAGRGARLRTRGEGHQLVDRHFYVAVANGDHIFRGRLQFIGSSDPGSTSRRYRSQRKARHITSTTAAPTSRLNSRALPKQRFAIGSIDIIHCASGAASGLAIEPLRVRLA